MAFEDLPSRLEDILDASRSIEEFVAGKSFDDYQNQIMLRLAVERCIEIISEASRHIPPVMKAKHPAVPWRNIADIGNVLRHAYRSVDRHIMWEVATRHIGTLQHAVERMLSEIEPDDGR